MKDLFEFKREFLEYCELEKGQSALTVANYDRYLTKFLTWLKDYQQGVESDEQGESHVPSPKPKVLIPCSITQESIRQYRLHINRLIDANGRELKKTTQNYHILAIRAFLRYLIFRGHKTLSPDNIPIAKTGDREVTFLEGEELEKILNVVKTDLPSGLRDRAILEFLFSTGVRVSELVGLNISDINFERGESAILGKGKKLRVVFISQKAKEWLQKYIDSRGIDINDENVKKDKKPLFASKKESRITTRTVERIVKKYADKAAVSKKVSPHTLRHSFATDLLIAGADIRSVQSLLGHSSITTTQVYTHITDQHLREIHEKFHDKKQEDR